MAIFVMSVGVLSMVVLYTLGLRESTQGQSDLSQSSYAEYLLNQAIGIAAQKDVTWTEWRSKVSLTRRDVSEFTFAGRSIVPPPGVGGSWGNFSGGDSPLIFSAVRDVAIPSQYNPRLMGIMVRSRGEALDASKNPIYYAEVMFQGELPDNGLLQ